MITIEQVDLVRERTNVSYQKAKEVLEKTDGNVVEAIVLIEGENSSPNKDANKIEDFGNEVIKTLKDLLKSGNVNRVVVEQKDGKEIMNIPVTLGAIGALFLTSVTVIGLIAAVATGCVIKIHKESGEVVNVNEMTQNMFNKVKENVDITKEKAEKTEEKTEENEEEK